MAKAPKRGGGSEVEIPDARPFPTREEILTFIRESPKPVGKREIARAFHLYGDSRIVLKEMLREMKASGDLESGHKRKMASPGALPEVLPIEIYEIDSDGEALGVPIERRLREQIAESAEPPRIEVKSDAGKRSGRSGKRTFQSDQPALGVGDRALVRLTRLGPLAYEARIMRRLQRAEETVMGVFEAQRTGGKVRLTERGSRREFSIPKGEEMGAATGDLVIAEPHPTTRLGTPTAQIVEVLGRGDDPKTHSVIAIHAQGLPVRFPDAAVALAEASQAVPLGDRTDLREIPLVTIDGEDARDFDDAVFAEADESPDNPGGWHLLVAIADVAYYVRPDDALDRSALERGNSAYFPDRVVPMLPEALSNGWCSLRPNEDRGCMAVHMWIDKHGKKLRHRFVRGVMQSIARLTYTQVQTAIDGSPDQLTASLVEARLKPLYGAWAALDKARQKRGTLDLDLPERHVIIGEDGNIAEIIERARHDSHRLIEEFMILANVAAAEELEKKRYPCMYRVHDEPDRERVASLSELLDTMGMSFAKGQVLQPMQFNQLLKQAADTPHAHVVNEMVLRTQAQAIYSPDNVGHFGLALTKYAHFTSPIRRYSDLLVHRALIGALKLGDDGMTPDEAGKFEQWGEHLSMTERRAAVAEREATDRFVTSYLANRKGDSFIGRVSGVTRFGLFVKLSETGADGLIPISSLPDDYYRHEEALNLLVGERWGRTYMLGMEVGVTLTEADTLS
ncbi:MAG: ribonuclease R [Pseudomonadota bacterium]